VIDHHLVLPVHPAQFVEQLYHIFESPQRPKREKQSLHTFCRRLQRG
jgi:RNA polymerase-interacting CarD/CdnL/TRCF family regulator